jgi:DNA-binding YbaB/EbfC family protein
MKIGKMMKDLQKMQEKMQREVEAVEAEGTAGGGAATARMDGKKRLLSLKLSPDAVTPDDVELMEDLIVAAVNEAGKRVDEEVERLTRGLAAGLDLPGLPGL